MNTGSMVGVLYVYFVIAAVKKPQAMPIVVPPTATTAKEVQPVKTSRYSIFSGPSDRNELNVL